MQSYRVTISSHPLLQAVKQSTHNRFTPLLPRFSPRPLTNTSPCMVRPQKKLGESGSGATSICGCSGAYVGGASVNGGANGAGSDMVVLAGGCKGIGEAKEEGEEGQRRMRDERRRTRSKAFFVL